MGYNDEVILEAIRHSPLATDDLCDLFVDKPVGKPMKHNGDITLEAIHHSPLATGNLYALFVSK